MTDLLRDSLLDEACVDVIDALVVEIPDELHYKELRGGELGEIGVF